MGLHKATAVCCFLQDTLGTFGLGWTDGFVPHKITQIKKTKAKVWQKAGNILTLIKLVNFILWTKI